MELATALDRDHGPVRDAMATGRVSEEQAAVIVRGVEALPVKHRRQAEAHLIEVAPDHDPLALRRLADHILEVVAPQIADAHELAALERQEALAQEKCRLSISDDGHGLCHGRFTLPSHVGAMLKQAVLAINAPKHRHHSGTPRGLGHAFCDYVTRYPVDRLPKAGGVDATVVVTMTLDQLEGRLAASGIASLDTGAGITAAQARKPPARPGSSRSCSAGSPRSSTSAASAGSTSHTNGSRSESATSTALPTAATGQARCVTSTTTCPEPRRQDRHRRRPAPLPPTPLLRPLTQVRVEDHPQRTRPLQPHVAAATAAPRASTSRSTSPVALDAALTYGGNGPFAAG